MTRADRGPSRRSKQLLRGVERRHGKTAGREATIPADSARVGDHRAHKTRGEADGVIVAAYRFRWMYPFIALACFLANLLLAVRGWDLPLLDAHAFRQTQTALSAYWIAQEGWRLDYITPVLGPPWSVPMEFPLYQWVVAAIHASTGYGLDQTCRLVSLGFLYLTLVPAFRLASFYLKDPRAGWILISLILINPVHIFWGRTALIETTALFLSTCFLWLFSRAMNGGRIRDSVGALAVGCLAGLVKPTTFVPVLVGAGLVCAHLAYVNLRQWGTRDWLVFLSRSAAITVVPVAATYAWTKYCDTVKALHPYEPLISTSTEIRDWNFGSMAQRLDWRLWRRWVHDPSGWVIALNPVIGPFGPLALYIGCGSVVLVSKSCRWIALALAVVLLSGPLIFFPLYRHEYYQMAVAIWSCGLISLGIFEVLRRLPWAVFILPAFLALLVVGYMRSGYMSMQDRSPSRYSAFLEVARFVEANTDPRRDALLVLGQDWSSEFAYYTRRKTRMHPTTDLESLTDPRFIEMCDKLRESGMRFGAIAAPWPVPDATSSYLLQQFTPAGAPTPSATRFPLSRDPYSAWPVNPGNPGVTSGTILVIPTAASLERR
jgi:4-amino-4-deoxy-L-arabinose transferase-like glycosyltransferase